ncbi:hypothetical protein [Flammeovirga sp. EKP202]|uniref:hypothetical protein n=1 Tax=Flammeovirga sp. EKP202 TaxID=2770592 RepID=UPI00165F5670|nr:hypothetical protein [Flammeovirga sp. EKP202]MBD0400395.1 hypothetical protein [Flammeovirga sp. EKP202]
MLNKKLFSRSGLLALAVPMFFTSCGPEIGELEVPPLEGYKIGIPLINSDSEIGFRDLLSEEDLEDLQTDPVTGDIFFAFEDSFDIASTNDLVQAFGSASEDDFFSINFPNPIPTEIPFLTPISVGFTADATGNCNGASYCIPLANDIQDDVAISYLRFERGGLQVEYRASIGDVITLSMTGVETAQNTNTITVTETVNTTQTTFITLPLSNVALDLVNSTPTLSISIEDGGGNPTGFISGIELTPTNTADRVKLLFGSALTASLDIPNEEIDTDYLSDIFPEEAQINFKSPTVQFRFNNPIGAGIKIDLGKNGGIYGENISGETAPLSFNLDSASAIEGNSCSQAIDVQAATDFDQIEVTNVFACQTAELLNIRPIKLSYAGEASYDLQPGDEVLFAKGAEVKAYFSATIPLYLGFTNMVYESGADADFDFNSEIEAITSAILRSEVTNGLPIGGTLKLTTKESENGRVTSEIFINGGNNENKLIKAAPTTTEGIVTGSSTNYLETNLSEDQVRAILNAGYVDISFELSADADSTTDTPDPVQITTEQTMRFEMGILLEGTINFESE